MQAADMTRECPMCGTTMRVRTREVVARLPGTMQTTRREEKEWLCPECEYFEEIEGNVVED